MEVGVGDGVNGGSGEPPFIRLDPPIELLAVLPLKFPLIGPLKEWPNLHIHTLTLVLIVLNQRVLLQGGSLHGTDHRLHRHTVVEGMLQQGVHESLIPRLGNRGQKASEGLLGLIVTQQCSLAE